METMDQVSSVTDTTDGEEQTIIDDVQSQEEFGSQEVNEGDIAPEGQEQVIDPVDKFAKRINKEVAKRKASEEELDEIRQKYAELEAKVNSQSSSKEITLDQVNSEISSIRSKISSGDYSHEDIVYLDQLRDKHTEMLLTSTKDEALGDIRQEEDKKIAMQREWQEIGSKYSNYGINDKNSQLFRVSKLYFEHPSTAKKYSGSSGMSLAVADAFADLLAEGDLDLNISSRSNSQLLKQKQKNALGTGGGAGSPNSVGQGSLSNEETEADYWSARKKLRVAVATPPIGLRAGKNRR